MKFANEKNTVDYSKLIIVDFDNTLCIHTYNTADISKGLPNIKLIDKLNMLHSFGYDIKIYTARGHLSAPDRLAAEKKYRPIIERWLKNNNVKYSTLSFNKPLAAVYIDDKSIRPDEFKLLDELLEVH